MTAWTEAVDGEIEYTAEADGTIWDDGQTLWDLDGNVYLTAWDGQSTEYEPVIIDGTVYSIPGDGSTVYVPAFGGSTIWT